MSVHNRVVWSQGMFLMPQHFQQQARHVDWMVDMRARAAGGHPWGFLELVLDEALLAVGRLGVVRAAGVLPDGTPFSLPRHDAAPESFEVPPDMKGELVVLALPLTREGVTQVRFDDDTRRGARWRVEREELRDQVNTEDEAEPVEVAALELRLMRAKDATDGHATLGVARIVERRADGQVVLDRAYIAPQARLDATQQLSATATLLHGLVQQVARMLAGRMGQASHGVSEMADFLLLQALNRAEPLLRELALGPSATPAELHRTLLQLAGDLSALAAEGRVPAAYPLYCHTDLQATFEPLVADLRRMIPSVRQASAVQITLADRKHNVRIGVFPDPELARSASFVLAVNAQMPAEQLRSRFPAQSKLGPPEKLRELVNLQLPGLLLRSLPTAPRQLPFHAGFHYFELDRGGDLWKQTERSGSLAMHVAGDFPALELELWAIRQ